MIRYAISLSEILRRIEERLPATLNRDGTPRTGGRRSWMERAMERTEQFRTAGEYNDSEGAEFWGEVKEIFAEVQGDGKCAFCEVKLLERKSGNKDGDIEHFRPKRPGTHWPDQTTKANGIVVDYPLDMVIHDAHSGYHLLAYHPGNYLLSCRICNQDYKRSYFPVAGTRISTGDHPEDYASEQPLLLYPIGEEDDNPEELIQFTGIIAEPLADQTTEPKHYWRARVCIDFFDLNGRDALRRERAEVIEATYLALTFPEDLIARKILENSLSANARHTNCARSFVRLFYASPEKARMLAEEAIAYIRK